MHGHVRASVKGAVYVVSMPHRPDRLDNKVLNIKRGSPCCSLWLRLGKKYTRGYDVTEMCAQISHYRFEYEMFKFKANKPSSS